MIDRGMITANSGANRKDRKVKARLSLPLNRNRARAYAAGTPTSSESRTAPTLRITLFMKNFGKSGRNAPVPETNCSPIVICLLYTSDAADDLLCVDLGGRRI